MGEGDSVNQTGNTTQNCTNCSEQDTISIAGKTFCANCGTPQSAAQANPSVQQSSTPAPSLSVAPHAASDTSSVQMPTVSAQLADKMPGLAQTTVDSDSTAPVAQNTVQTRLKADQLNSALSTQSSPSIAKFSSEDTSASAELPEDKSNSEMGSLNDKVGESVMSDETLDALANTSSDLVMPTVPPEDEPATPKQSSYKLDLTQTSSAKLPKAVSDIRPGVQSAPAVPTQVPASIPVPPITTAAAIPTATSTPTPVAFAAPLPNQTPVTQPSPNPAPVQAAPAQPAVASVMDTASQSAPTPTTQPSKGLKASSVALSLVGLLLLGGYVWQVNYPNLALKVAGSKAGISANFPGYIPSGWKLSGNIQSTPGNISYNIANTKSDKAVQVSESKTSWDSQALAENYVAPKSDNYLALQAQGLTIYLYDGNQASWVNNGTWYRIEGSDHGLSQDQVIKLATSL
jgi:hypothetical protein